MSEKEYIDRWALISEYDRVHKGPAGGARKLMIEAPTADVEARRKWIPVTERLPKLFEDVLCFYAENHGRKVVVDYLEDAEEGCFGYEFGGRKVTHWMPLPEPPEAEKGGAE